MNEKENFINISNKLSLDDFENIKNFVLEKGDTRTYRSFDNDNPHYSFEFFDVFLGSDIGQKNMNNNPEKSDFNELTIADWDSEIQYFTIIAVRNNDIKNKKEWFLDGMKEESIYLVDHNNIGIETLNKKLSKYLKSIHPEMVNR